MAFRAVAVGRAAPANQATLPVQRFRRVSPVKAAARDAHNIQDVDRPRVPLIALLAAAASVTLSAQAADLATGARVFNNTCGACHTGGQNIIETEKTLEKESLVEYLDGGFNEAAIIKQVQNGKGAMPAWSGQLSEEEIQSVAAYVFNQADKGLW